VQETLIVVGQHEHTPHDKSPQAAGPKAKQHGRRKFKGVIKPFFCLSSPSTLILLQTTFKSPRTNRNSSIFATV
jgi:hypothetical protein